MTKIATSLTLIGVFLSSAAVRPLPGEPELSYRQGWIRTAIADGRTTKPTPYILRAPSRNGVPTAWVYTPFVRVAILSRQAAEAGHTLRVEDVPSHASEPLVYVRFLRLIPNEHRAGTPPVFGIVPTGQVQPEDNRIDPVWVRKVAPALLKANPNELETQAFYPVAAFALESVRPGYDFVVYHKWRSSAGAWMAPNLRGVIREEDFRSWR